MLVPAICGYDFVSLLVPQNLVQRDMKMFSNTNSRSNSEHEHAKVLIEKSPHPPL
jgi:hypothetical protein